MRIIIVRETSCIQGSVRCSVRNNEDQGRIIGENVFTTHEGVVAVNIPIRHGWPWQSHWWPTDSSKYAVEFYLREWSDSHFLPQKRPKACHEWEPRRLRGDLSTLRECLLRTTRKPHAYKMKELASMKWGGKKGQKRSPELRSKALKHFTASSTKKMFQIYTKP